MEFIKNLANNYNIQIPETISFSYWKLSILLSFVILILTALLIWLVCSYYTYKWFKMNIDKDYYYFNEYNSDCKEILQKYGEYSIKRLYLVRQPITKLGKIILNIVTLYKFEQEMKKYMKSTKNDVFIPRHTSIIIEIKLPDKTRKHILIEKNNCIKLALNFKLSSTQEIRKISIGRNKYTLKNLLEKTRERVGNNLYFNWSICRNNCQMLTKEILITLGKFNEKNKKFLFQNEFANQVEFSEFSLHVINTTQNICNSFENFIGRTLYF